MKGGFINRAILGILLTCQFTVCLATGNRDPNKSGKYLDAVREFVDNVLKYGRDTYGPKHTPLFVDGLNIHTHEPVEWISPEGDRWILSNLASQQNLLRTLDGLSKVTGDPKYRKAAEEAVRYAIENLQSTSGLFYWGGHAAYDAQADEPCGRKIHELKGFYPYYRLMWEVNPTATRRLIESFWAGHILNWSSLDMNRHYGQMSKPLRRSWDYRYNPAPVFKGGGFSPSSTGGDLYYAGALLAKFTGEQKPLTWAKRLAYRYVETRHPNTGISARVFTVFTRVRFDDEVLSKLSPVPYTFPWQGHANRSLWESHFGYDTPSPGTMVNRVTAPWLCQLMLGELLGSDGKEFIQWSLEELTAWGKVAYRKEDNTFVPRCYDGTVVEGYECKEDSPLGLKGSTLEAVPLKITELWAYALAYCLTKDAFMWEMARNIALANDCGDLGATVDDRPRPNLQTTISDPYAMVVFLELHRRIGKDEFLRMAQKIGDNILTHRFYNGFVSPDGQYTFTKFDDVDPLALLHLHAALSGKNSIDLPQVWPSTSFFEEHYRSKDTIDDNQLIYSLKGVSEPPRSLQEAAAEGDLEVVNSMISQGVDVDKREDSNYRTALHRAVMAGHRDVAKLLLEAGARPDARSGGSNSLHYAIGYPYLPYQGGHKEIVELLIEKGADVNAKNNAGRPPLGIAAEQGYKEIVELLVAAGADVNAKNDAGRTPLDVAVMNKQKDIAQLLVDKGAKLSSFMLSFRLTSLLAQKDETNKTQETNQDQSGEKPVKEEKNIKDTPDDPNFVQSPDTTAAFNKPYVVLERGDVRAVILNNEAVDDEVLPGHRGGYSGVASLTHKKQDRNIFVPFYAGLNFEHIHDGTNQPRDILFEPRRAPMQIKRIDKYTAELYQPPTPHWQLESWLRYQLLEDGVIEMTLECIPRAHTFKNDYIGLFFASYIDKPESLDIHFIGRPADQTDAQPRWIRGVTPAHGTLPTHLAVDDNRNFAHDPNFPLTLVFNRSNYRYAEPWYYGVSHGMAFVLMFRPEDNVRLSQSPSGGGDGNPAWDFQWFVPQYKVGQKYRFVMRAMYLPFESQQQIIQATAKHRAALE